MGRPAGISWLVARPIAHRGLHDRAAGRPENTVAAARAAIAGGYAIECDVQISADGEAMVFHDAALGRLTGVADPVAAMRGADLARLTVAGTAETIPTLPAFLSEIAGRTPLVVEIKSSYSGDLTLTRRVADILCEYAGPVAVKSFDPQVVAALRGLVPETIPRGIVGETNQDDPAYAGLTDSARRRLSDLLHIAETRPGFVSWRVDDLPCAATHLARVLGHLPVMAWTVRNPDQRRLAEMHADQMVFEGFSA
ncbi:glycerophosphodiester phosphodiesterase [Methylobacterium sp. E-041]|jgi:glycerophosphoryl diester phosphodiesterase|uniref:glycerophosphodiester phosphodiesterase family protein n=1 Tax=unclassified Methylobacterium TaxID=2615210 RepID=UPI0011CA5812|nr:MULTISPECIES: glycerophosphodiester phosphodiesterase family protein [unclassified Methylobacterium]MCJ2079569.1 glycerophosphodiester phosphodiesterase [Methylobacterium sp. E-016]MCJ2108138.1 glycerophosphodiester phosphodiesterase [Methylobacterium sp. E-041]MCJ2112892.1 glycerophosphodiester phosphodiesterase [Methylobacterium sp. E-025]TXM92798.1 glycerophosphodiester phosphodiesterase [Methylobacterium sp. WL116]TXN39428.1 glycerophosphodiester phosphodiesterase [Methylobacterium sp. 